MMSTWDKSGEAWALNNHIDTINDPLEAFKAYCQIKETEVAWDAVYKIFGERAENNKEENIDRISGTKKNVDGCLEKAEDKFISTIDHWIYSVKDTDHDTNRADAIQKAILSEHDQTKYNMLYLIAGYSEALPVIWDLYQKLLEKKHGMKQDEKYFSALSEDIANSCSELHKAIYDKDAGIAYV